MGARSSSSPTGTEHNEEQEGTRGITDAQIQSSAPSDDVHLSKRRYATTSPLSQCNQATSLDCCCFSAHTLRGALLQCRCQQHKINIGSFIASDIAWSSDLSSEPASRYRARKDSILPRHSALLGLEFWINIALCTSNVIRNHSSLGLTYSKRTAMVTDLQVQSLELHCLSTDASTRRATYGAKLSVRHKAGWTYSRHEMHRRHAAILG
jgi:hypothetical protein